MKRLLNALRDRLARARASTPQSEPAMSLTEWADLPPYHPPTPRS
jgi:hypothetical protein